MIEAITLQPSIRTPVTSRVDKKSWTDSCASKLLNTAYQGDGWKVTTRNGWKRGGQLLGILSGQEVEMTLGLTLALLSRTADDLRTSPRKADWAASARLSLNSQAVSLVGSGT